MAVSIIASLWRGVFSLAQVCGAYTNRLGELPKLSIIQCDFVQQG